jgi:6-phosphogluconolactonase (cycloisomerase 2 family)
LRIDQSTGALAPAPGSPIALALTTGQSHDIGVVAAAVSNSGKLVYAAVLPLSGEGQLFGVSADANSGELRPIAGTPLLFSDTVNTPSFGPGEKVLYVPWINESVGHSQAGRINVYSIAADGALTLTRTVSTGGWSPGPAYLSPSGTYVIVPQRVDAYASGPVSLATFVVDPATGVLGASPASVIPAGVPGAMRTQSLSFHPSGKFAYLTLTDSSTPLPLISRVAAFRIDVNTGMATPVPGTPVDTNGTGARASRIDPTGRFLYLCNSNSSTIQAYAIDQTSGALTPVPGAPFTAGANVRQLEFDTSGRFLFSLDSGAYTLSTFAVDQSTGALSFIRATPTGTQPSSMEIVELP